MKKLLSVLLAFSLVLMVFASCSNNSIPTTNEELFKDISSTDLNGEAVDSSIFKGKKLTMVNIWATFCGPCINEMPDLEKLSVDYKDKDFQIIGIVCDVRDANDSNMIEEAKKIVKETGVTYKSLVPSDSLNEAKLKEVYSVPETIFIDEDGNQVGESYIGSRSYESWKLIVDGLLAEME